MPRALRGCILLGSCGGNVAYSNAQNRLACALRFLDHYPCTYALHMLVLLK
jgi:hypothetical protein